MASIDRFVFAYEVVACSACDMVYAAQALAPDAMHRYYCELSKYDWAGEASVFDRHRAQLAARFTAHLTTDDARILDVGCSTGLYLSEVIAAGRPFVAGIEPSQQAVQVARDQRGLDVTVGDSTSFADYAQFDVVALLAVLEHLRDPARLFDTIAAQMKSGALLIVEVPDADAFGDYREPGVRTEPYGEFSLEHINFFGEDALRRLGGVVGLAMISVEHHRLLNGAGGLFVAFRKQPATDDSSTRSACNSVVRYIERSALAMRGVEARFASMNARCREAIVYGAGSHTARLIGQGLLDSINVPVIVDRNINLVGRRMEGIEISAPTSITHYPGAPVIVSTFNASESVAAYVRAGFPNQVVELYSSIDVRVR